MKFGAEIVPYYKPEKLKRLGKEIESSGFDFLWISDHYHNRFVHSILTYMADRTERINLGPGVTNPYLIHPAATAAAIATLDELSDGRATLGISAGDPSFLNSVGVDHSRPITAVREAIQIIRRLLNEERIEFSGDIFTCREAKLGFSPIHDIPIYVGGRGEQMMQLAGKVADGALINASHPEDLKECIELVDKGAKDADRSLTNFDKVAYMATSIDEDEEKARNRARAVTSFVAASAPESTLNREKISMDRINEIRAHLMDGETKAAKEKVTEKMIDVFSVSGTIDKLENRIKKLRKIGVTQVVIGSPIGPDAYSAIDKIEKLISRI